MANNDDIEKIKFNPKVLVSGFLFSITAKISNKMLIHKDNTKPSIPVAERKVTLSSMLSRYLHLKIILTTSNATNNKVHIATKILCFLKSLLQKYIEKKITTTKQQRTTAICSADNNPFAPLTVFNNLYILLS